MKLKYLSLILIGLIFIFPLFNLIQYYENIIYITAQPSIEYLNVIHNIKEINISSITLIEQSKLNNISTEISYIDEHGLTTDNLKLISGRFFISDDIEQSRRYVVIQDILAIKLFATTECINKEIEISNQKYTIIGIVKYKSKLTSLVENIPKIYLPYSFSVNSSNTLQSTIKIVCNKGTSYFVSSILEQYFDPTDIIILKNSTNEFINKIILCIYLVTTFLIVLSLKILTLLYKELSVSLQNLSHKYYLLENLKLHKKAFILIFSPLINILFLVLITRYISFSLDPNLLPSTLASTKEILQHTQNYINFHKYSLFLYKDIILFKLINITINISILFITPTIMYYAYQIYLICIRKITYYFSTK